MARTHAFFNFVITSDCNLQEPFQWREIKQLNTAYMLSNNQQKISGYSFIHSFHELIQQKFRRLPCNRIEALETQQWSKQSNTYWKKAEIHKLGWITILIQNEMGSFQMLTFPPPQCQCIHILWSKWTNQGHKIWNKLYIDAYSEMCILYNLLILCNLISLVSTSIGWNVPSNHWSGKMQYILSKFFVEVN